MPDDQARLDWLERIIPNGDVGFFLSHSDGSICIDCRDDGTHRIGGYGSSLRDAIDAAMNCELQMTLKDELTETRKALFQMQKERDEAEATAGKRKYDIDRLESSCAKYAVEAVHWGDRIDALKHERNKWKALADRLADAVGEQVKQFRPAVCQATAMISAWKLCRCESCIKARAKAALAEYEIATKGEQQKE